MNYLLDSSLDCTLIGIEKKRSTKTIKMIASAGAS
jgi:hypothetical protein